MYISAVPPCMSTVMKPAVMISSRTVPAFRAFLTWRAMHHSHWAETEMSMLMISLVLMFRAGLASAFCMKFRKAWVSYG